MSCFVCTVSYFLGLSDDKLMLENCDLLYRRPNRICSMRLNFFAMNENAFPNRRLDTVSDDAERNSEQL